MLTGRASADRLCVRCRMATRVRERLSRVLAPNLQSDADTTNERCIEIAPRGCAAAEGSIVRPEAGTNRLRDREFNRLGEREPVSRRRNNRLRWRLSRGENECVIYETGS